MHRYDLVDISPHFQHVIATILQDLVYKANRLRYFNNEFQTPIRFGVPPICLMIMVVLSAFNIYSKIKPNDAKNYSKSNI